jgi:hypothetical protein
MKGRIKVKEICCWNQPSANLIRKLILISIAVFFSARFLTAQSPFIQLYTTADGLPSNYVSWILQDSQKFLWIATDNGVTRYDGATFKHFDQSDGLCDNFIVWMREDDFGRIWFNGMNRKHSIFYENKFLDEKEAPFLDTLANYLRFFQDRDGAMYFYSRFKNSICLLDTNNTVVEYQLPSLKIKKDSLTWEGMVVHHMAKSNSGDFLIWTYAGVFKTRDLTLELVQIAPADDHHTIYGYTDSTYYDMVHYPGSDTTFYIKYLDNQPIDTIKGPASSTFDVEWITEDSNGLFWITRSEHGLFCLRENKVLFHLDIKDSYSIIKDHQGYIWASSRNGVYKINPLVLECRHFDNSCFNDGALLNLSADPGSGVWGINGKSAYLYQEKVMYHLSLEHLNQTMNCICALKDNTIIVGDEYYHKFLLSDIKADESSKNMNYGKLKRIPTDGQLMINHFKSEFALRNLAKREQIYTYSSDWQLTGSTWIDIRTLTSYLFYDSKDQLLVNAPEFSFVNQVIMDNKYEPYEGLSCMNGISIKDHIILDTGTDLFYSRHDSIYLVNQNRRFNFSALIENYFNTRVKHFVYADPDLYLATEKNIYKCEQPLKVLENKSVRLQVIDIDFLSIRDILIFNDSIYVASDEGLTIIPVPGSSDLAKQPPQPYLKDLEIDGEEMIISASGLRIKSNSRVKFGFGSIDYSRGPHFVSYKMEGLDKDWIFGESGNVTYGSLPPGKYIFKVQAGHYGGSVSNPIELPVEVKTTLLQNPFFYIIITLLISSLIYLIIIYRKNQVMRKREIEHQLVTLEQKALQSMMNPHFLFNALGSIQNYLLQNRSGEAGLYLSQFARLIRQNIHGLHSAMISIDAETDRLKNYLDLEKMRMDNRFEYRFFIDENIEEETMIPTMIIQPFVENSILHGISPLEKDGMINLSFVMPSEKTIKITIEDNGIGIGQARAFANNSRGHLHMSMEMTRKRIAILGKKFKTDTSVEVAEAFPGRPNPGTRVVILLPVAYGEGET